MDKFLQRPATWKTKTYEAAVAAAAQKRKPTAASASSTPSRRPLQPPAGSYPSRALLEQQERLKRSRLAGDAPSPQPCPKASERPRPEEEMRAAKEAAAEAEAEAEWENMQPNPSAAPGVPTPKRQDSHWARLQQDFNSPNAALRMRALRALKSPSRNAYNCFDVPQAEQSIITAQEREAVERPSLAELLKEVRVFVEVRSGHDNRSEGVKAIISKMGAQINDRLLRNTTHVVFKDGLLSTYKKASEWKIPIVSILWIEACKVQRKICEPSKYPISNIRMYEYPELYGKIPRIRCMQPDSELNKRPRKQKDTPTSAKDIETESASVHNPLNTPTTTKNDISRFFRAIGKPKATEDAAVESPATNLLNRISSGRYNPLSATPSNQKGINGSGDASVSEQTQAKKSLRFVASSEEQEMLLRSATRTRRSTVEPPPVAEPTPAPSTRRRSCAAEIGGGKEPRTSRRRSSSQASDQVAAAAPAAEPRMTRRRSSLMFVAAKDNPENTVAQNTIQTITEEEQAPLVDGGRNSMPMEEATVANKTDCVEQSLDISEPQNDVFYEVDQRATMYTSERMDITTLQRRSVATPSSELRKDFGAWETSSCQMEEVPTTPLFSSTRLPSTANSTTNRRRTILNIINESIEQINSSHRRSLAQANEAELGQCRSQPSEQEAAAPKPEEEPKPVEEPKKRRLFNPNDEVVATPTISNRKSRLSIGGAAASGQKRRRSVAVVPNTVSEMNAAETGCGDKVSKPAEVTTTPLANKFEYTESSVDTGGSGTTTEAKPKPKRSRIRTLVHTNMHHEQIQFIHKALRRLRGMRLDPTVTQRTTHLVSLEPRRTLNLLRGLMRGVWIVSYQWVIASVRAGKWIGEEPYEMTRFSRAIEICRAERQAFGIHYQCELFRFMEHFYVSSLCQPIQFNNMKELLLLGGAKLTENRFKAKYIIGDKRRAEDERIYLSPYWVLDSITNMQIQRFGKYLMKSAIITPAGIRYENPTQLTQMDHFRRNHEFIDPPLIMDK
ncbi:hypothetical protein KR018_002878 [Drosophila ironensis]|nr:hypothetical protein KR018_002878 [Drosophila ironensis]